MPKRIKVLIELNYEKYSLIVDSNNEEIRFDSVLNQFIEQTKQNVSFDSHLFEIYDSDFKEYVLIASIDEIIDNLSRIRVKPKDTNQSKNQSIDERLNRMTVRNRDLLPQKPKTCSVGANNLLAEKPKTCSDGLSELSSNSFENNINNSLETNRKFEKSLSNTNQSINNLLKLKNFNKESVSGNEDLISHTSDDSIYESSVDSGSAPNCDQSLQTSGECVENPINYLDLKLSDNHRYSPNCLHLAYKTLVIDFRNKSLVIIRFHVNDYKAIQFILDLLDINRRCFERNPSNTEPEANPKWKTVSDQMISNGFDEWSPKTCRDGFTNALELYKKTLEKCPDFETADKVYPLFGQMHWFDLKYIICLSEFNEVRDLRQMFSQKKPKPSLVFHSTQFGSNLSLASNQSMSSRTTNHFHNQKAFQYKIATEKTKIQIISAKLNHFQINTFKALCNCVDTVVVCFGSFSQMGNRFWDLVSNQMRVNGYKDYSTDSLHAMFIEHVCDYYSLVLTHSTDYTNATEIYPLFELIHSMDLSQCLADYSFNKIRVLREKFDKK